MKFQLILLAVFLSVVLADDSAKKKLQLLCENKQVDITRSSQVKAIIEALDSSIPTDLDCPEDVKESILALQAVIEDNGDACSMDQVERLRDYHFRFISTVEPEKRPTIPKSLRQFAIGFGLTISKQCKKLMINSLLLDSKRVAPEDYEVLEPWYSGENALLKDIGGGPSDFDDLLSIRNLLATAGRETGQEKVFVHSSSGEVLSKVQSVCVRKFKPLYEKLILPLVELSNFNYNYQGEELERELAELATNEQVQLWYKITYLCESLGDIDLIQEPNDIIKTEGINRKLVRILTKEEAEEFKKNGGISLTETSAHQGESLVYKPETGSVIPDEIIDHGDKNMEKLILGFDAHVTESDRVRVKVFKKLGSMVKQVLLRGKISLASTIFNELGSLIGDQDQVVPNENIVTVLDHYIKQTSELSDDSPVGISAKSYGLRMYHKSRVNGVNGIGKGVMKKFSFGFPKLAWSTSITILIVLVAMILTMIAFCG